MQLLTQK